ncbi:MAG TPA: phosphotransferase [Candidatus Limnocylindria bacterium]|nr:phosphotransferase [Candidatus Limnocylindria bacterium]
MAASIPHDDIARVVHRAFGASTVARTIEPLAGDASSRRYLRVRLDGGGPATAVVMVLAEGPFAGADELGGAAPAAAELPFVAMARYLARHGLRVPAIYEDASRECGLVLLEDIGDTTLWAAAAREPARAATLFADAVDLLVALQVAGARDPDPACPAFARRFDVALASAEIEHFVDHGIETRHGIRLSADERAAILDAFAPCVRPFADGPFDLSHRDYMAWNIHWHDGGLVLIDFQDALLAPDTFDLAQLLTDRITSTLLGAGDVAALSAQFARRRAEAGLPLAPGFADRYERCVLQHALKVIGRFHQLELVKGKRGYLAYLPAVYAVARRALAALPDCRRGAELVARWVPELAEAA